MWRPSKDAGHSALLTAGRRDTSPNRSHPDSSDTHPVTAQDLCRSARSSSCRSFVVKQPELRLRYCPATCPAWCPGPRDGAHFQETRYPAWRVMKGSQITQGRYLSVSQGISHDFILTQRVTGISCHMWGKIVLICNGLLVTNGAEGRGEFAIGWCSRGVRCQSDFGALKKN